MADLRLEALEKAYGESKVVDGFTLHVKDGEFVSILGPSGCGKTTTLRMVAGFIKPSSGSLRLGGRVLLDNGVFVPPEKRNMGMVFQSYAVWPHMTVAQNVEYPLKIRRLPQKERTERLNRLLKMVGLEDYAGRYANQLSGGQQQRVALARALVMEPELLLLDEPLSNLDAKLREKMRNEIKDLQVRTGITILFVTHDQQEAMSMSDRIVVMKQGVIQQQGTPEEIYRNPVNSFVADFIGKTNLIQVRKEAESPFLLWEEAGLRLPIPSRESPADTAALSVRPHHIRLIDSATEDRAAPVEGVVKHRFYLGENQMMLLDVKGQQLEVVVHPDQPFVPGQKVGVIFEKYNFV